METMKLLSAQNLTKWRGRTCLLRIDLNIEPSGELDSFRLNAVIPTVRLLVKNGVRVVIASHRGRPRGVEKKFSLSPFAPLIAKRVSVPVDFIAAYRVGALRKAVARSTAKVVLLENLRFFRGEETNDPSFARALAQLGDCYVNDAFSVSHRANASVVAVTRRLPSYAGLVLEREVKNLGALAKRRTRPFTFIVGGSKIADKVAVLGTLGKRADRFLVGGGPANTFFMAQGLPVGNSLVDAESLPFVKKSLADARVVLPVDVKIHERRILDIGPRTIEEWRHVIKVSRTIVWAGPPGLYSQKGFAEGTKCVWRAVLKNSRAFSVVGGGETTAALALLNGVTVPKNVFISTGGGAMLEFLSGKKLPGIQALK
jgi:phosphoglycerate kinase